MPAQLEFDPFAALLSIFNERHPDHEVTVRWAYDLAQKHGGWGATRWYDDRAPEIWIDPVLPLSSVVETLAHELAHVAAGQRAGHGKKWKRIYGDLFAEYTAQLSDEKEDTNGRET